MFEFKHGDWRLRIQGTPTYRPEAVKEITGGLVRLGDKATDVLRRLEERPGFPMQNSMNNPGSRVLPPSNRHSWDFSNSDVPIRELS